MTRGESARKVDILCSDSAQLFQKGVLNLYKCQIQMKQNIKIIIGEKERFLHYVNVNFEYTQRTWSIQKEIHPALCFNLWLIRICVAMLVIRKNYSLQMCDLKTSWDKKAPIDTQKQVAENICKLQDCRKE